MHPAGPDTGVTGAEEGKALTLVLTDVEGSTELWEWDHAAMMEAIRVHDCLMRAHLRKSGPPLQLPYPPSRQSLCQACRRRWSSDDAGVPVSASLLQRAYAWCILPGLAHAWL